MSRKKNPSNYYAVLVRYTTGNKWHVYNSTNTEDAAYRTQHLGGAIEVLRIVEITEEEYRRAQRRLKRKNLRA